MSVFRNAAAEFVYYKTYSRWLDTEKRRETWNETVSRYVDFLRTERGDVIPAKILNDTHKAILNFEVMPSMRALWSAGDAARKNHLSLYNCSHIAINNLQCFGEVLYILMHGTGVGFSVENHHISKLPPVPVQTGNGRGIFKIKDSKLGWKQSVDVLIEAIFNGEDIEFDYSGIRPRGARLKTFGGRASGPEPLRELHKFMAGVLSDAQGRRLTDLECHDIICKIADVIVSGGVRRSALISISDQGSVLMRHAKDWDVLKSNPHRYLSNNSAVYNTKPDMVTFLDEWVSLAKSGTGERGIYNTSNLKKFNPRRDLSHELRPNPCLEILLRSDGGLCNLSEVVLRAEDDWDSFLEKIRIATWIGAIQATFTDFPNMSPQWKQNCEDEYLLGVSITGQMDNPDLLTPEKLEIARKYCLKVMRKACKTLGINESAAVTCVKPSGSVSQVVDSSSGMHVRYAPYYIRRYRIASSDPLCKVLVESGFGLSPENGQSADTATTYVVSFPVASPAGAITRHDLTAIEQLEWYKKVQNNWSEHNVSCTIYVRDHEWLEVANWVYNNWDNFVGISFLPFDGGHYEQMPYEEITKEAYDKLVSELPVIDYSLLQKYESEDMTEGQMTLACVGGACELS